MAKKEYTLTAKSTVTGMDYHFSRGDVITEEDFKKLSKKHQAAFEEGRKDLTQKTETPASAKDKADYEALVKRVENLEHALQQLQSGGQKEPEKKGGEKEPAKTDKK